MAAPNVTGFIDAQANLRRQLGADVVFKLAVPPEWPEGTKINPDTDEPYDPTIKEISAPYTEVTKKCLVILKQGSPLRPQADTESQASGEMSGMDIILDIAAEDYSGLHEAFELTLEEDDYRIREAKPFTLAGVLYRYLIYGMQR